MARTTPVHSGYTIINGSGSGSNGNRIDVWAEYKLGTQSVSGNYTPITVYFYAALNSAYSSTTKYVGGLNSTCKVNGTAGTGVTAGDYDFTSSSKVNFLGSYSGNIAHDNDGKKTVSLNCSFTTKSSYITGGSVSANVSLPTILRASAITAAAGVILGKACSVKWTPNSTAFRYKLKFSIGSWSYTTAAIHPNKTSAHTYTSYTLPIAVAAQITGSKTGTMTVVLTTYSDSGCTTSIGTDSETFTVTVPENADTKPTVTMELSPVQPSVMAEDSPLYGLYLQGITRIKATLEATAKLSTSITAYGLEADEKKYSVSSTATEATIQSNPVVNPGKVIVTGKATDKRTITGSTEETLTVLPYSKPTLKSTAYRCNADMSQSDTGTFLKIDIISSSYAPVEVDGEAQNSLSILWRYRAENGMFPDTYTEWTDEALLEGTLAADTAYEIEIMAVDMAGQKAYVYVSIPTENIYMHKPVGGKGMGLGGYCTEDDMLDLHWRLNVRQGIFAPSVNYRGVCEDVNTAYLPGTYSLTKNTANSPYTVDGILLVFNSSADGNSNATIFQVAVASGVNIVCVRTMVGGTASTWRKITMS